MKAINEIVAALPEPSSTDLTDPSLAAGAAGLALFCAYLSRAGMDDDENATQFLSKAIRTISSEPMRPSLYVGFAGIAWVAAHLHEQLFDSDDEDPNAAIDSALIDYLSVSPWEDDYDLISGLAGIGVYALERLPRPSAIKCLELIVDRLDEKAEHNEDGITWLTHAHLLPKHQREQCPNGYYNLGLAHGLPGLIALLGQVCAAGVAVEKAQALLNGAVTWILRQRQTTKAHSTFSHWINPNDPERDDCRLAWCYGDAGVSVSLLLAARCMKQAEWEREALKIARRAARRKLEDTGVVDACLCHGAAGLGHIFNRLFQASGEKVFRDAARSWFERTLNFRRPNEGFGGFLVYRVTQAADEPSWEAEPGILEGAAGIALALLAASTPIEPAWDRMLLVSPHNQTRKTKASCQSR